MRRFKPLPADHPLVGEACPACRKPFAPGDETTLIPLGPGDDPEGQKAAQEGRAYIAVAAPVHWLCAGGSPIGDAPDAPDDTAAQLITMLRSREQRILELQEALATTERGECGHEGIALRLEQERARAEERWDCRRGPGWASDEPPCGACVTCAGRLKHELRDERDLAVSPVGKMHP